MKQQPNVIIPELVTHEYEGHSFVQRKYDGYVNLTDMVKVEGKQLGDWKRLNSTRDYINEVSGVTGIPVQDLLYVEGDTIKKVTWGHPMLALHLAKWISPAFHVFCNKHLLELMTKGETRLQFSPNLMKVNKRAARPNRLPSEYAHHLYSMRELLDEDLDLAIHMFYSFAEKLASSK